MLYTNHQERLGDDFARSQGALVDQDERVAHRRVVQLRTNDRRQWRRRRIRRYANI